MRTIFMALTAALFSATVGAQHQFLVFGDMPYSPIDEALLTPPAGPLYQGVRQTPHHFIVHVGDIKAGAVACTDHVLRGNYQLVSNLSERPFVYTPGDNDWTDCDRKGLSTRYDELERLSFVRKEFAVHTVALHDYERQPELPENQAWRIEQVQYLTVHVVGTNNGRAQILKSHKKQALQAVKKRDQHNIQWLKRHADKDLTAMVVFFQADIFRSSSGQGVCSDNNRKCDGFAVYRQYLDKLAQHSDYPILVVHGDTSEFCFSQRQSQLWHLNAPGDFQVLDIAHVTVNVDSAKPFQVSPLLTNSAIPRCEDGG
ncbi:hypothetical protein CWC05_05870 [Pseudoalteromonas ruthenica]|uniref:Calcineurin-like phosphoesterase domain-containing protein n=1 Tax=Pseudoalteromonas ruthenica TaxID=151081 RepID=A0A5S3Z7H7_9GAMM|nr:hypothetical protein [Pseudoalteromonas ruthenica]TMP87820.1 hypothetical protein CWC05_05870 [Pseudoalteromonas ruthenica]